MPKEEGIGILLGIPKGGPKGSPEGGGEMYEDEGSDESYTQEFLAHIADTGLGLDEDQAMALKHAIEACVASKMG